MQCIASHERALNDNAYVIRILSKVVQTYFGHQITQKPTVQPIMNFSQIIYRVETRPQPKIKKKNL